MNNDQPTYRIYLSLGSNMGNRFSYLQKGIDRLFEKVGSVFKISSVYETPAMGFTGDPFLNCVVLMETQLDPTGLLESVLKIEELMGRQKNSTSHYKSRPIDIDILFIADQIIKTERLTVPHPEIENRKFVLQPLNEIAPEWKHPVLKEKISDLLKTTSDTTEAIKQSKWLNNPMREFNFSQYNYITIEGNLGVGKTILATKIATDFNARLILERFQDNPFLPKFYEDPSLYAFRLELSFLVDRYQQIVEGGTQLDMFKEWIITDYEISKSLIFAGITLPEDEFLLYRKLFQVMQKDFPKPDLYIYLLQDVDILMGNIKKRGRVYEQDIKANYLEDINRKYLEFLRGNPFDKIKIIDISGMDFITNREDYLKILKEIVA